MIDIRRLQQTTSAIEHVYTDVEFLRIQFAQYELDVVNINARAQLYGACYLDDWTIVTAPPLLAEGEVYPAQRRWDRENFGFTAGTNATVAAMQINWEEATEHFNAEIISCNTTELRLAANDPGVLTEAGVQLNRRSSAWAILQLCLLAAQILLSVSAVRLVFHAMVLCRPWVYSSGLVDVHTHQGQVWYTLLSENKLLLTLLIAARIHVHASKGMRVLNLQQEHP